MNISVLLRLLREPLASGQLIGQVEVVDTGERVVVHDEHELVDYLREQARAQQYPGDPLRGTCAE